VHRLSGENTGIPVFSGVLTVGKALLWLQHDRYREITGRERWLWPPKHYDRFSILNGPDSASVEWPPAHAIDDAALQEFLGR
jgi:hypothetical protein